MAQSCSAALKYVWEHHRNEAEWFLKADDDTWVFTNNLRLFLDNHDPNEPHYFGFRAASGRGVGLMYYHGGTGMLFGGCALSNSRLLNIADRC